MRPSVSLLLCATIYFAGVNSQVPDSTPTVSTRPGSLDITHPSSNRRIPSTTTEQAEERLLPIENVLRFFRSIRLVDSRANPLSLARKITPMEDMFTQLRLNERGEKLFEDPKFFVWDAHLNDYNIKFRDKEESMLLILTQHYNPDDLAKMIEVAKMNEVAKRQRQLQPQRKSRAEILFIDLQERQMDQWQAIGANEAIIFDMLRLYSASHVDHLTFRIWLKYAVEHCSLKKARILKILRGRYFDKTISWLLAAAKQNEFFGKLANDLQKMLTRRWLKKRVTPETVFELLMLDTDVTKVYNHPERRTWEVYARHYHDYTGLRHTAFIDVLELYYGEKDLLSLAVQLVRGEGEEGKELARQLQDALVY